MPRTTFYIVKQRVSSIFAFFGKARKITDFGIHFGIILEYLFIICSTLFRHRCLDAFSHAICSTVVENGYQKDRKSLRSDDHFGAQGPPQNAPKTHPRRNLDFLSIWDRLWEPFWSAAPHRGGEHVRLLESIRYFQVSTAPLPPGTAKKSIQNLRKSAARKKMRFFGIKFRHQFLDAVFSGIFHIFDGLWIPFWLHLFIICHTFCMPFSSMDFALILYRFLCISRCPEPRFIL